MKSNTLIVIIIALSLISCKTDNKAKTTEVLLVKADKLQRDTATFKETFNEEDIPANEYLIEELKPIRANFKRINTIPNAGWSSIVQRELDGSTEGGVAIYYYRDKKLEKVTARHFGEMGQKLVEYYLLQGQLSFVLERSYQYNRPIYHDSSVSKYDEAFDYKKSEITEDRSYFVDHKLIHQLNNEDCGAPFADDYLLEEQKRIQANFDELIKLVGRENS